MNNYILTLITDLDEAERSRLLTQMIQGFFDLMAPFVEAHIKPPQYLLCSIENFFSSFISEAKS